jgi:hypothetical protein
MFAFRLSPFHHSSIGYPHVLGIGLLDAQFMHMIDIHINSSLANTRNPVLFLTEISTPAEIKFQSYRCIHIAPASVARCSRRCECELSMHTKQRERVEGESDSEGHMQVHGARAPTVPDSYFGGVHTSCIERSGSFLACSFLLDAGQSPFLYTTRLLLLLRKIPILLSLSLRSYRHSIHLTSISDARSSDSNER